MAIVQSSHYHALIMAGGKGERFWPWSREKRPKHLLPLFDQKTLIEITVKRLLPLIPKQRIWIVTNAEQARAMSRLMPSFPKSNFIVEPVGRDSAGAVMLGCARIALKDPDAVMALLAADHLIKDTRSYLKALRTCFKVAAANQVLLTIGIKPASPSTSYGYIERGQPLRAAKPSKIYRVRRFLEKPLIQIARRLVKSKRFYWNSGMFVWSAKAIREAFKAHSPVHDAGWRALHRNYRNYLSKGFTALPKISIDYAVMEKAKNICVAEGNFDWDDVGSWIAFYNHIKHDKRGNCSLGNVIQVDSHRCLVFGGKKVIATLGVKDFMIVQTDDATLICHRDEAQRVKEIVQQLPVNFR